ncbi:CD8A protein, partial [Acrocephalus arundinaceus]|nr:CD8A protein [Acrocephalus arundinaceus]
MDTSPALILLLILAFCEYRHGVRSPKDITQLQVGQKLELECHHDKNTGAFWIHQDKRGTLHFIVFINSASRVTFEGNQKTSTRFEAWKERTFYHLVVKSFTPHDEGKYFCVTNFNQNLYFSHGQPAFLPDTTAVAPITPAPTTQRGMTEKDSCLKTPDPDSRRQEDLDHSCLVFLWVRLASLCLLLLQLLAITIVLCRCRAHH